MTSKLLEERYREALRELSISNKDNMMCVDCMTKKKSSFVVLQFQSYICEMCADVHRTYGHRGVKQIGLSNFTKEEVEEMRQGGNQKVKANWYGGNYDQIVRPNPDLCASDKEFKEKAKEHIKKVYIQRLYKSGSGSTPGNVSTTNTPNSTTSINTSNNQQVGSGSSNQQMPYNNVQYNNGGIDTRTRGASLNTTQYANLKTTNSSSIIQSSNISGVNGGSGNKSGAEDLISFGGSDSKPIQSVMSNFNQPTYGQPQQPPMMNNNMNQPMNNNNNMNQPSYNNNNNYNYPPNNNYNNNYNQGMSYGNQPMNNNMNNMNNSGYGYNNQPMMNNNMNGGYNNNYGYNNNGMMNNNMNQPMNNNMNQNYGYGQPQQPQYNNNNMNNYNMGYGQPQQPMMNSRPQISSPPQTPPSVNNNYGMTPNVNTVPRQPSVTATPVNPMGYNNQYGTPMTPSQPSQPSTITPVNPYVNSSPRGNNVPTPPPSTGLSVSSPSRSASMPPKTTPPSFTATQPVTQPPRQPTQPTQPVFTPSVSSSSSVPKRPAGSSGETDNLSKQFNNMSLSSSTTTKPVTASTVPKSNPPPQSTTTTTTPVQKPPVGVTNGAGLLVGSTKKIDSSEFEKANRTGVDMDDLRGNASKDNVKFKEINPNRVIPMKQTTEWQ